MKEIIYDEYLSTSNDNYVDVENPADCSTRFKNESVEIMVHKSINKDDELSHCFDGHDENVCIIYKETDIRIVYDCTWEEILNEYK